MKTKKEMIEKALEILSEPDLEYESVMRYSINETAKFVMKLYRY